MTMLPNKASNAVLAKARAMYGRRLTDDDYRTLAGCRSMPELAGALKTMPLYTAALVDVNPVFARRASLENDLNKSIFARYASLCRYDMSAGQDVYRYFILCSDLDEITACLRCLDSGRPGDYLYILPDFLQKHTSLDLYRLAKATDAESFLKALSGTPYAAAMEADRLSPLTMVRTGRPKSFVRLPSMSASSGCGESFCMARSMARNVACKILISSISCSLANAMP